MKQETERDPLGLFVHAWCGHLALTTCRAALIVMSTEEENMSARPETDDLLEALQRSVMGEASSSAVGYLSSSLKKQTYAVGEKLGEEVSHAVLIVVKGRLLIQPTNPLEFLEKELGPGSIVLGKALPGKYILVGEPTIALSFSVQSWFETLSEIYKLFPDIEQHLRIVDTYLKDAGWYSESLQQIAERTWGMPDARMKLLPPPPPSPSEPPQVALSGREAGTSAPSEREGASMQLVPTNEHQEGQGSDTSRVPEQAVTSQQDGRVQRASSLGRWTFLLAFLTLSCALGAIPLLFPRILALPGSVFGVAMLVYFPLLFLALRWITPDLPRDPLEVERPEWLTGGRP